MQVGHQRQIWWNQLHESNCQSEETSAEQDNVSLKADKEAEASGL